MSRGTKETIAVVLLAFLAFAAAGAAHGSARPAPLVQNPATYTDRRAEPWFRTPLLSSPVLRTSAHTAAVGGVAAYLSRRVEDPERMAERLEGSMLEVPADVGNVYGDGLTLGSGALGLLLLGRITGDSTLTEAGKDLAGSLLVCGAVVQVLKVTTNRTRPNGGKHSFPSGHTAAAFATAPVLHKHFGLKAGLPAYALAVSSGLGRMKDRKHYLSDVLFGAFIGIAIGDAFADTGVSSALAEYVVIHPPHVTFFLDF